LKFFNQIIMQGWLSKSSKYDKYWTERGTKIYILGNIGVSVTSDKPFDLIYLQHFSWQSATFKFNETFWSF
jgi:hypothetical protein